jgi:hypothetical protein
MRNGRAFILCCCLGTLPLIGCTGPTTVSEQSSPSVVQPAAARPVAATGTSLYGPKTPAAVLVFLPGSAGLLADDLPLWAAQGFDVLTPRNLLTADAGTAIDRLLTEARALTSAPIWLVGEDRVLREALDRAARLGDGTVSGIVTNSPGSDVRMCRESLYYSDRGDGSPPRVLVRRSGNACPGSGAGSAGITRSPSIAPAQPSAPSHPPRVIEASATPGNTASEIERIAQLIKESPSS